jgi:SAM-dependent methyltransferase
MGCPLSQDTTEVADKTGRYLLALIDRHLKNLRFSEVTKGLRALSVNYVEAREDSGLARALDGRGKQAAFALYYGATHFLATGALVRDFDLGFSGPAPATILDLGCGTGVCGAAWALCSSGPTRVIGADRSSFALHEARWTYATLRLKADTTRSIEDALSSLRRPEAVVLGWALNELDEAKRDLIAARLVPWVAKGSRLLVIEPVSKRVAPWWREWTSRFPPAQASVLERSLPRDLPPPLALLAKSAGLSQDPLVVRVLVAPPERGVSGREWARP